MDVLFYVVFCASLGICFGHGFDIVIDSPPLRDVNGEKTAMIPTADGGFIEVNVAEAMAAGEEYFVMDSDVYFELYTRRNSDAPYVINMSDPESIRHAPFNADHPTRIAVHGWGSSGEMFKLMVEAYFEKTDKDFNFIAVNWTLGASAFNYLTARNRVDAMGLHVARFVRYLVDHGRLDVENVVLIGHSLGAHIVGIAGKKMVNYTLPKIVGLDPASPFFSMDALDRRLAKGDARYVEIIHSGVGYLALSGQLGNASFYPNGGRKQPGCGWDPLSKCAHSRSYVYYAESIHNPRFYAWQCESHEELLAGKCHVKDKLKFHPMGGEFDEKDSTGVFYLSTNDKSLFARGKPLF